MVVIENKSKSVKVLKASGMPALRLFPGFNYVDVKNPKGYLNGNPAAKALFDGDDACLKAVESDVLTPAQEKEAQRAKEKNDDLNRAQRVIKQQKSIIDKSKDEIKAQAKTIEEQSDVIESQGKAIKEQGDLIADLQKSMAELKKEKKKDK